MDNLIHLWIAGNQHHEILWILEIRLQIFILISNN
jgi:hypothetical protein